jgi:Undecaprenyl-phosphate galactose phosphotransferase WbaP
MQQIETESMGTRFSAVAGAAWSVSGPSFSIGLEPVERAPVQHKHRSSLRRLAPALPPRPPLSGFVSLTMFGADLAALTVTCALASLVVMRVSHLSLHNLITVSLSLAIPILMGNLLASIYPGVALNPVVEFRQLSRIAAISFLGVASLALLGRMGAGWYLFVAVAAPLQFMLAPLGRAWVRAVCCRRRWWGYPVMVFGSGEATSTVVQNLLEHPAFGLRPAVVVDPSARVESIQGLPVFNRQKLTSALVRRMRIRHAIVVLPDLSREQCTSVLERHARGIRHVMITSAISPFSPGLPILWRDARDLAGVAGVEVRNRLLVPTPRLIKRSMDVVLTVCGGVCILPVVGVLAALVKLTSRGPVFYGHTRIGERGRTFSAWKFRSMVVNGEDILREHLAGNPDARLEWDRDRKLKNDPRVTPVGAFLRKTSLDELPQLWNVLRGDMSLVGPRPIVRDEIVKYGRCYKIYKAVRPGITGLWQVSGRNDTTYGERLRYDEFYVRNWSPWLDMHILARTVATLVCGRGAY